MENLGNYFVRVLFLLQLGDAQRPNAQRPNSQAHNAQTHA